MMETPYSCAGSEQVTAFFTGHRHLPSGQIAEIGKRIRQSLMYAYNQHYRCFYCGGALGFDTLAAREVLRFRETHPDVSLVIAVPCSTQADRWKADDQKKYRQILDAANRVEVLSPVYYNGCMLTRNRYMADRSSLCICFLQQMKGGTAGTVRYAAVHRNMRVMNLAMGLKPDTMTLKEVNLSWSYTFISPFAGRNAVTVPLRLSPGRKLTMIHISGE